MNISNQIQQPQAMRPGGARTSRTGVSHKPVKDGVQPMSIRNIDHIPPGYKLV